MCKRAQTKKSSFWPIWVLLKLSSSLGQASQVEQTCSRLGKVEQTCTGEPVGSQRRMLGERRALTAICAANMCAGTAVSWPLGPMISWCGTMPAACAAASPLARPGGTTGPLLAPAEAGFFFFRGRSFSSSHSSQSESPRPGLFRAARRAEGGRYRRGAGDRSRHISCQVGVAGPPQRRVCACRKAGLVQPVSPATWPARQLSAARAAPAGAGRLCPTRPHHVPSPARSPTCAAIIAASDS